MCIKELVINGSKFIVFGSSREGFYSSAVLYIKNNKGLLFDTLLMKNDTKEIIRCIKENKILLETIFITHYEPDYYFGLECIKAEYSDVKVIATKKTIELISKTGNKKLNLMIENDYAPSNIVLPFDLKGTNYEWNGTEVKIIGKNKSRIIVYFEKYNLVLGGPNLFENVHPFLGDTQTKEERLSWVNSLLRIKELDIDYAIAGHVSGEISLDGACINTTLKYLFQAERMIEFSNSAQELYDSLKMQYPEYKGQNILSLSSKILKGEKEWY